MAERRSGKPKAKPRSDDSGVLASLPATRPQRIGGRRRSSGGTRSGGARSETDGAKPAAAATASTTRRKPAAKKRAATKKRAAAKPRAAKPAAPKAVPISEATGQKPKPVRSGASGLDAPAQKAASKRAPATSRTPSGTELVTTVVQAAGELAQVGLSIGGQVLKRAVERLPKP
jgi:hypothetical protein